MASREPKDDRHLSKVAHDIAGESVLALAGAEEVASKELLQHVSDRGTADWQGKACDVPLGEVPCGVPHADEHNESDEETKGNFLDEHGAVVGGTVFLILFGAHAHHGRHNHCVLKAVGKQDSDPCKGKDTIVTKPKGARENNIGDEVCAADQALIEESSRRSAATNPCKDSSEKSLFFFQEFSTHWDLCGLERRTLGRPVHQEKSKGDS